MKSVLVVSVLALLGSVSAAEARGQFLPAEAIGVSSRETGVAAKYGAVVSDTRSSIIDEASRWMGSRNMTGKPGPWCASFASFVLRKTGHEPLASDTAGSALSYGPRLSAPKVGSLAVISTSYGWAGHVGFVSGVNPDGSIQMVSGNWGHRVAHSNVSRRLVVAFVDVK